MTDTMIHAAGKPGNTPAATAAPSRSLSYWMGAEEGDPYADERPPAAWPTLGELIDALRLGDNKMPSSVSFRRHRSPV